MKAPFPSLLFLLVLVFASSVCKAVADDGHQKQVFIVYMGSSDAAAGREFVLQNHLEMLSSVLTEEEDASAFIVHSYSHALSGFSAFMSKEQATQIAKKSGVVSVFPDSMLELHTTHSWDFLDTASNASVLDGLHSASSSADTIVGLLDTGILTESPSFNEGGLGPVPSRWKGQCMESPDFKCNKKIIGAKYYKGARSARDTQGHGTHTASTAAGVPVQGAEYFGLAKGTAKGGSPGSRIAVYKVCSEQGCSSSDILAGIDDAVHDGVDVISISLGSASVFQMDFLNDPIAIGSFHAIQKGVLVVCSGGNDGPEPSSVVNTAPWILTVAATTIDRDFESDIVLGNGKILTGTAINFSNLTRTDMLPIVYADTLATNESSAQDASNCYPGSLDPVKTKGKIVVCSNTDTSLPSKLKKATVQSAGGRGMVLLDQIQKFVASNYGTFPLTSVMHQSGNEILSYIKTSNNPVATILRTRSVVNQKPAPAVAFFSSRGPGALTESILKPDVSAPGVDILAAWVPGNRTADTPMGEKPSYYALISGTSMACPHVSGTAALVKSVHPTWTASSIRSAIMTSATSTDNSGARITEEKGGAATPFDVGAGLLSPARAVQPGLVYDTPIQDYLVFLCAMGYKPSVISSISGDRNFTCPPGAARGGDDAVTDINYPSIAVAKLGAATAKSVKRTVTNVGPNAASVYEANVESPPGLTVTVTPPRLTFSEGTQSQTFRVEFKASGSMQKGYGFGSITWSDGSHFVRTPFAVSVS